MSDVLPRIQAQIMIAKDPPPGFALHERYDVPFERAGELIAAGIAVLVEVRPQRVGGVFATDDERAHAEAVLLALVPPPAPPETIVIVDEPPAQE